MFGGFRLSGVPELKLALKKIEADGQLATIASIKALQNATKARVRSRLRGRPRWNHRGASSRTGEAVNLEGPRHITRGGGPGKFTGKLSMGVGSVKVPKKIPGGWEGGVGVGPGKQNQVRNLYMRQLEEKYPYFKPAMDGMELKAAAVWEKAWTKVVTRRGW